MMDGRIEFKPTGSTTVIEGFASPNNPAVVLEVPTYINSANNEEYVTLADLMTAYQRQQAEAKGLEPSNIYELALLYADVHTKKHEIKQKFRFNKMMFYLEKRLQEIYGEGGFLFDEINAARAGPIPVNLKQHLKEMKEKGLVEITIEYDGKRIPDSAKNWEELLRTRAGSCVVTLTKEGEIMAQSIWTEMDQEVKDAVYQVKKELNFMTTESLMEKVHKEYPEMKKNYTENDKEDFC